MCHVLPLFLLLTLTLLLLWGGSAQQVELSATNQTTNWWFDSFPESCANVSLGKNPKLHFHSHLLPLGLTFHLFGLGPLRLLVVNDCFLDVLLPSMSHTQILFEDGRYTQKSKEYKRTLCLILQIL